MRYEIVVTDENRPDEPPEEQWEASLFLMDPDDPLSGEYVMTGTGSSGAQAVRDLLGWADAIAAPGVLLAPFYENKEE